MEQKGQNEAEFLTDIPNITGALTDEKIDDMDSDLLAKVYYKKCKQDGYSQKIDSYFVWSNLALKRAIKRKRDYMKAVDERERLKKLSMKPAPLASSLKSRPFDVQIRIGCKYKVI